MDERIAIIGAGPAGCAAARVLHAAGRDVVLFERSSEVGGRTWTFREGADHLDTGAGFLTNFYPRVMASLEELGLEGSLRELHRITGLHRDGRTARLDVGSSLSLLAFPFVSLPEKLRMGLWTLKQTRHRRTLDLGNPDSLAPLDTRSIAELADDELTPDLYHHLIRPGIEPFWYFACEEASAALAQALTAHAAGARFYCIQGGIDQLCRRLSADVTTRTQTEVTEIVSGDDGLEVAFSTDDRTEVTPFDKVLIATTATVAHRLTTSLDATFVSLEQRQFLESQRYAANLHIAFRIPRRAHDDGLNAVFPVGPGDHPLAALSFNRAKELSPQEHEIVSVYLSSTESQRCFDMPTDALAEHALTLARQVAPDLSAPSSVLHVHRRREAIPIHEVGRYHQAAAFHRSQLGGKRDVLFAGDYLATATVDGAVATGLRAARAMLEV